MEEPALVDASIPQLYLIPALREIEAGLCELEASLVYSVNSRMARVTCLVKDKQTNKKDGIQTTNSYRVVIRKAFGNYDNKYQFWFCHYWRILSA